MSAAVSRRDVERWLVSEGGCNFEVAFYGACECRMHVTTGLLMVNGCHSSRKTSLSLPVKDSCAFNALDLRLR